MSYHMFDAVIRGMVAPADKVAYTNTINNVLCISDTLLWCLVGNSSGKTVPTQLCTRMMRNCNKLVCYYIWKLYYIRTSGIIWTFWIQILQWLSFKFYLHLLLLHLVGCVLWCVIMYTIMCVLKVYVYSHVLVHVHLVYWRHL